MKLSELKGSHLQPIAKVQPAKNIVIDVWGEEQTGKSHFASTMANESKKGILYQTLEPRSTNDVLAKFADKNVVVGAYESEIPIGQPRKGDEAKGFFDSQEKRFKADLQKALELKAGGVVWDKATQVWELIRLQHFGQLTKILPVKYAAANSEYSDLVSMPSKFGASMVLINEAEDEWVTTGKTADGKDERNKSGKKVRKGQERTGYLVDVSIRMFKLPKADGGVDFFGEIRECRQHPEYIGTVLQNPDFITIATMVKPEVDWSSVL